MVTASVVVAAQTNEAVGVLAGKLMATDITPAVFGSWSYLKDLIDMYTSVDLDKGDIFKAGEDVLKVEYYAEAWPHLMSWLLSVVISQSSPQAVRRAAGRATALLQRAACYCLRSSAMDWLP